MTREELKRRVRDAGLRATAPRIAVLDLLAGSDRPLSHSEVVEALGGDEWDQATLYRNLVKLTEARLARVASQVGGVARYEALGEHDEPHLHPHFACTDCKTVVCLHDAELVVPRDPGWREALWEAELQLVGRCPRCRRNRARRHPRTSRPTKARPRGSRV